MFDLNTWQQQTQQQLQQPQSWLEAVKSQSGPYALYGGLTSLVLWPVAEALALGDFFPVMKALLDVAGESGGHLLGPLVQSATSQADLEARLQAQIPDNPDLRQALNAVLERLAAIPHAYQGLSDSDKQWFLDTLPPELRQLGAFTRNEAQLVGPGLVIQESQLQAGDRSVVASQARLIVTGDNNQVTLVIGPETPPPSPGPSPDALTSDYLNALFDSCRQLPLSLLDKTVTAEDEALLSLSEVYTALLTESSDSERQPERQLSPEGEDRRLSALAMLDRHPHLVLLGDPGSGKTTFVNFVTLSLAGERLGRTEANLSRLTAPLPDDNGEDREERQPWSQQAPLPLRIILRDFAARGLPPKGKKATAKHLWKFITRELADANLEAFAKPLTKTLREAGGLLLFDGLDEVPEADARREQIIQAIDSFRRNHSRCRMLVTSRTYAYENPAWHLPHFTATRLAPFSRGQIIRFVDRWYEHVAVLRRGLSQEEARERAALLKDSIFSRERLLDLAERPLLLALMAQLHAYGHGRLPERRERLYAEMVDLLLDRWERPKRRLAPNRVEIEQPALLQWLGVDKERLLAFLEKLAFEVHRETSEQSGKADIEAGRLMVGLLELSQTRSEQFDLLDLKAYLEERAGLLVPRSGTIYNFPHRTFQEYLAARYLSNYKFPGEIARLARQDPDRWREVALLAGAKAASGSQSTIWSLARKLCWTDPPDTASAAAEETWGAHLAGQALVETANMEEVDEDDRQTLDHIIRWQVYILEKSGLPATERAIAGQNLARLGDPRRGVLTVDALELCYVPPGPFMLGSGDDDDLAYDDEKPSHEVDIPYGYWLARYPVTVAQFQEYVNDSGEQPSNSGSLRDPLNHPVRWVSWPETLEFCRWLSLRWWAAGVLPDGWRVTLPSEPEWEKATRGGLEVPEKPSIKTVGAMGQSLLPRIKTRPNPDPYRRYPWGNDPDPERANYSDTKIGQPSTAGSFPAGISPYGCEEMSGNLWEWTRSLWGQDFSNPEFTYPYNPNDGRENSEAPENVLRVLRGGAFFSLDRNVRCAFRLNLIPSRWDDLIGFRVLVSPF